jgi:chemotaxis response regulator CheB
MSVSREPLRAVIVDDEPLARRTLRSFLSRHEDVAIAAECANGGEAIAAIRTHRPDLVFPGHSDARRDRLRRDHRNRPVGDCRL